MVLLILAAASASPFTDLLGGRGTRALACRDARSGVGAEAHCDGVTCVETNDSRAGGSLEHVAVGVNANWQTFDPAGHALSWRVEGVEWGSERALYGAGLTSGPDLVRKRVALGPGQRRLPLDPIDDTTWQTTIPSGFPGPCDTPRVEYTLEAFSTWVVDEVNYVHFIVTGRRI